MFEVLRSSSQSGHQPTVEPGTVSRDTPISVAMTEKLSQSSKVICGMRATSFHSSQKDQNKQKNNNYGRILVYKYFLFNVSCLPRAITGTALAATLLV